MIWLASGAPTSLLLVLCAGGVGVILISFFRNLPILALLGYTPLWLLLAVSFTAYTFIPLFKITPEGVSGLDRDMRWKRIKWADVSSIEVTYLLVVPHVRVRTESSKFLLPFLGKPRRRLLEFLRSHVSTSTSRAFVSRFGE